MSVCSIYIISLFIYISYLPIYLSIYNNHLKSRAYKKQRKVEDEVGGGRLRKIQLFIRMEYEMMIYFMMLVNCRCYELKVEEMEELENPVENLRKMGQFRKILRLLRF